MHRCLPRLLKGEGQPSGCLILVSRCFLAAVRQDGSGAGMGLKGMAPSAAAGFPGYAITGSARVQLPLPPQPLPRTEHSHTLATDTH